MEEVLSPELTRQQAKLLAFLHPPPETLSVLFLYIRSSACHCILCLTCLAPVFKYIFTNSVSKC